MIFKIVKKIYSFFIFIIWLVIISLLTIFKQYFIIDKTIYNKYLQKSFISFLKTAFVKKAKTDYSERIYAY